MQKLKPQFTRWLYIDEKIRSGCFPNCSSMAEEYEVDRRTIHRDIDYLKHQLGAPIEYDASKKGYYYTENDFRLPAISIKESELFALYIAEKVLQQYENTPLHETMARIFGKIARCLPDEITLDPNILSGRFSSYPEPAPHIAPEIWTKVFESLRYGRVLHMEYSTPGSTGCVGRRVRPYHVVSYRGEWYLIGHCDHAKAERIFAFSRISSAGLGYETYTIPDEFDFQVYMKNSFGIFHSDESYQVRIEFSPSQAPYVQEREWHETQKLEGRDDGSLVLSFTTNNLYTVKRWVLSYGPGAKVLGPQELVYMVRQDLKEALGRY